MRRWELADVAGSSWVIIMLVIQVFAPILVIGLQFLLVYLEMAWKSYRLQHYVLQV